MPFSNDQSTQNYEPSTQCYGIPKTMQIFSVSPETHRTIEWWALLNCFVRPSDFPDDADEAAVFRQLTREIPESHRLGFWNGGFRRGVNRRLYI
jgi:hypothetical protein